MTSLHVIWTPPIKNPGYAYGWKYRLVIDNRNYILCFSAIDYRRCFAFNFFYRLSAFQCFLLTFYRLVESLNFTFVLVESAYAYFVSFLLCYIARYNIILKVYFFILDSTGNNSFSTRKFHSTWSIRQKF